MESRLAPSGARTTTWNCDSSSLGRKFLFTAMNSGTMETNTSTIVTTTIQRWAMAKSSRRR